MIGVCITEEINICMPGETDIDIEACPFQALLRAVEKRATVARASRRATERIEREGTAETDGSIAKEANRGLYEKEINAIGWSRTLASWDADEINAKIDDNTETMCELCQ